MTLRTAIRLTRARRADADACAAILHEWIAETGWFPTDDPPSASPRAVAGMIRRGRVTVARADGIAGFAAVEGNFLRCLYVARDWRGQGLGRALLDDAKARSTGNLRLWTFRANMRARRFYQREGFAEVQRTDGAGNEEGLPDIEMLWQAEGVR
jgi:GNAT superfamily N-acetyltransferase